MKIGLWADNVNFPSLPMMKLSAYHKERGDEVKLITTPDEHFNIAYVSKTFNLPGVRKIPALGFTPNADIIHYGGSGEAIAVIDGKEVYSHHADKPLPEEIEHIYPDYGLYSELTRDTAFGFLSRGCPNNCGFCIVTDKEGCNSVRVAELSEFWRGQRHIKLMDANLLACADRDLLIQSLIGSGAQINFTQGLDARFVDEDIARLLCKADIKLVHLAFDLMKNEREIVRGLEMFRKHFTKTDRSCQVYILTNYNTTHDEDWYRVRRVIELGYQPDVRIYRKGTHDRFLTDLSRWANAHALYRSSSFEDYVPRKDGKRCGDLYKDIVGNGRIMR